MGKGSRRMRQRVERDDVLATPDRPAPASPSAPKPADGLSYLQSNGGNADVGARAFTTGSDVFFGAGQYAPDTPAGAHLIAHELVHTTQPAATGPGLSVSDPADRAELAADSAARVLTSGGQMPGHRHDGDATVHRAPDDAPVAAASAAPVVDISWIGSLPGHIQEQIDMFKQSSMDNATGAKHQKQMLSPSSWSSG